MVEAAFRSERDGIAVITYRWKGETRRWSIGCDLTKDNKKTIRGHLERWIPGAEFVKVQFQSGKLARSQDRLYCRWCPFSVQRFYRLKSGQVRHAWKRMRRHVAEKHDEQWQALQQRLLSEGLGPWVDDAKD